MSSQASPEFTLHYPPAPVTTTKPSVILFGNIDKGSGVDWRDELASALSNFPISIINPDRKDWNSSWVEDISFPKFKEQVEWEMEYAQVADIIVFHFAPDTLAPVSLLELGMYCGTGRVLVCCQPEFKKRGNVQMVCAKYSITLLESLDALVEELRQRLKQKLGEVEKH
jgi:hypothetical protein